MGDQDYINDRKDQEIKDQISNSGSILGSFTAGLGAIALGSAIYARSVGGGGRLISNLLHFLGHPRGIGVTLDNAANVGAAAPKAGTSGLRSVLTSSINIKTGKLALGPIDLIDDARSNLEVITAAPNNISRRLTYRFSEYVNRKFANRVSSSYFAHDLQRVTISEVLNDQAGWSKLIGTEQWDVLHRARAQGLVTDKNILDNKIYKTRTGTIRDLRISSIFTRPITVHGPSGPVMERAGFLDLFGQGKVLSGLFGEGRGFAVLASDKKAVGTRFFIDGDIYTYRHGPTGTVTEHRLATGRTLIKADSPLVPVQEAREGTLKLRKPNRKGIIGEAINKFEMATGVGRTFSSRPSIIERFIINPARRYASLSNDEALIYRHGNRYAAPFSKAADAMLGGSMPEAVFAKGAIVPVPGGDQIVDIANLSMSERLAVIFDVSDTHSVIKRGAYARSTSGGRPLGNVDLVVPRPDRGIVQRPSTFYNKNLAAVSSDVHQTSINSLGGLSGSQAKFIDVEKSRLANSMFPGLTSIRTLLNYTVTRTSSLASESLLGIAFAPAKTLIGNLARLGSIPLMYDAMKEGIGYLDFLSEEYLGFSPIKTAASLYAKAREMQQSARSALGIQQSADYMEKNFPGSVDSEGAYFFRSLVAPLGAAAYILGKGNFKAAAGVAGAIYAAIGGSSPGQTSEELKEEYLGNNKVPVRKGALWGLGYLPFFGGKADYFDYSWYHKLQTDYQTKSMYGNKSEYFQYHASILGLPFPTPHNLFGIKNLLNPYRFEDMHSADRPYPTTGSPLEEFPIIGPLLSATLGRLIKPKMSRQMDMPLFRAGIVQPGLDPGTAEILGMSKLDMSEPQAVDPSDILYRLNKLANVATEPMGVYKFVMEFMGLKFGNTRDPMLASSELATSEGRLLYDKQLGGMFGQTEFIRRFFLSDYSTAYSNSQLVNNIKNSMPSWLPGKYSEIAKDQEYYTDFTQGDPFIKIPNADARLPGKGYEALNDLHSGRPGEYDDIDKFLILSDVAPYSQAYRTYASRVSRMQLDPHWQKKVDAAIQQREEVVGVDKRYLRYSDTLSDVNQATKDSAAYKVLRGAYDTFTHDFLAEIPWVGSKLFPFRNPYEQYRKYSVEGSEFASWNNPVSDILMPMISDMASVNPFMAAIKGGTIGYALSTPMKWFNPIRTTVDNSKLITRGAIVGGSLSMGRILSGAPADFIPGEEVDRSNTIEYMDAINYLKYRSLSDLAAREGSPAAGALKRMTTRTMLGANTPIMLKSSLPTSTDRRYFDYFLTIPENNRAQVYEGVPDYMKNALSKAWSNNYSTADAEQRAANILGEIPDADWIGWHPSIPIRGTKIHLINHGINGVSDNYQKYGFYESQENEILNRIPNFNDQDISYLAMPANANFSDILAVQNRSYMKQFGGAGMTTSTSATSNRANRKVRISMDRSSDTYNSVNMYYGR